MYVPRKRQKITGEGARRAASLRQPHIRWHGYRVAIALRELVAIDPICKLRAGPAAGVVCCILASLGAWCYKKNSPRGWPQLGGGRPGDAFWRDLGGDGPAAGALIGLIIIAVVVVVVTSCRLSLDNLLSPAPYLRPRGSRPYLRPRSAQQAEARPATRGL
jgi:hypothetical protein